MTTCTMGSMIRALMLAALLVACGGGSNRDSTKPTSSTPEPLSNKQPDTAPVAPPKTSAEQALEKMVEFRDKMCACKDSDCAKRVSDELTQWSQEEAQKRQKGPLKMSEEETKRATDIGTTMGECMYKAMGN